MDKIYNFSAGQASLPFEVLQKAREELISYGETGVSVMEIGDEASDIDEMVASAEKTLRRILNVPSNYKIIFMPGDSSLQFSAIPLNLLSEHRCADYIVSGQTSKKAVTEAKKYGNIAVAASSAGATPTFSTIPETKRSDFRPDADYVHLCYNNMIYGTRFHEVPDTGNIPIVADVSSSILSEPMDISRFGMIYASAQMNISVAGMTVVIIRDDLIGNARIDTPANLNYADIIENGSAYSTPPVWSIYIAKLVFEWIESIGGLEEIKRRNEKKASLLYDYLDGQHYYTAPVDKKCRSMTNVVFLTGNAELDEKFIEEADAVGLKNLKGHRSVGGMRASIYNAMPYDGVVRLVAFMKKFALEHPKF